MSVAELLNEQKRLVKSLPNRWQSDHLSWIKRLQRRHKNQQPIDKSLAKLQRTVSAELARWQRRKDKLPSSRLNESLPLYDHRERIVQLIDQHQVVIVAGETGSGKTTQLPQLCLDAGLGLTAMIGHTQPRRIAATAVARRIAEELNCVLGEGVGYQIRFDKKVTEYTYIKVMTDGVLLNELHEDPLLYKYDILIVDEAHERSLNIDFILGVLKGVLSRRKDFKLVITSATIDLEKFSRHFNNAPIVEVSGRTYPVEMRFRPMECYSDIETFEQHALAAVRELMKEQAGDVLIFLPSEQSIRHLADYLRRKLQKQYDILPLYSRLARQQQQAIFQPHNRARIVLATNVAETSLTVPGIRYVIDSGLARISRYSTRSKIQRLPIEAISQASANQRAGRCGRMEAGICIRLYSEEDFLQRPEFVEPEILRTNLATVILQMAELELGAVEKFEFIDPPMQKQINDGIQLLIELQAMEEGRQITKLGNLLARLPVDPRIGRILIAGAENNALREVTIIAAMIGIQDPRERPVEHQQKADEFHARFVDKESDFLSLLSLWNYFEQLVDEMSWNQVRKRCLAEFIHYQRMREWREQVSQLLRLMRGLGFEVTDSTADYEAIHKSLLSGFLTQVGNFDPRGYYLAPRQVKLHIFPGSGLFRKPKRVAKEVMQNDSAESKTQKIAWIMAAELVETSRNYARMVARIQPEWIELYAASLLKIKHSEPYWSTKGARAMVKESGLLFGLPVYTNRRKGLADINQPMARDMFISDGIVDKGFRSHCKSLLNNWDILSQAEEIQNASRRHDFIVSRDWFVDYYNNRVPAGITSGAAFDKWCKRMTDSDRDQFCYSLEDICSADIEENKVQFPDTIYAGSVELSVEYQFKPGQTDDGMHILVPLLFLNQINTSDFQWLVPGLFEELIIALIRALPKAKRKQFVPVPNYARALIERLEPALTADLYEQVANGLQKMSGQPMSAEDFVGIELPANLKPTFVVIDGDNNVLGSSTDLESLQGRYKSQLKQSVKAEQQETIYGSFPDSGFEYSSEISQGAGTLTLYQGLRVTEQGYQVIKSDDEGEVRFSHLQSLAHLVMNEEGRLLRDMSEQLHELKSVQLVYATLKETDIERVLFKTNDLFQDLVTYSLLQIMSTEKVQCTDRDSFAALVKLLRANTIPDALELASAVREIFKTLSAIREILDGLNGMKHLALISSITRRLDELLFQGFIHTSGDTLLRHYPRFLKGLLHRIESALLKPQQEKERSVLWDKYWDKYCVLPVEHKSTDLRHSMEEFHVMTFAQQLGTKKKVSEKRLKKLFAEVNSH